ncbi:MAG TPA: GNAT family N-acetyltransferase [Rhizobiaceae bacterium]|nr:GNAT family N-acetyltransferase [Rhizobiaceae bacterium]
MSGDVTIRAATAADADAIHAAIVAMSHHVGAAAKVKSGADDLRRFGFGENACFEGLVAEVDGTFAGMCLFFPSFSTWLGRPGVYVQDIFVDETFRGRGVGEKLIARVAAITAERGGIYLRLSVDVENISAQAFYSSLGMGWAQGERLYAAYGDAFTALAARDGTEG